MVLAPIVVACPPARLLHDSLCPVVEPLNVRMSHSVQGRRAGSGLTEAGREAASSW